MKFNNEGISLKKFPLNHKDSMGHYRYYTITNLQKTLEGGFAFTFEHPSVTDAPWYLVVTDSNMLVNGRPFWHKFYSGDTTKTVGFNNENSNSKFGSYPNPTTSNLYIELYNGQMTNYSLQNLNGQILLEGSFENKTHLDVSNLSDGIYFLQLKGEGILETRKVIVSH